MKKCKSCGKEIDNNNNKYCSNCKQKKNEKITKAGKKVGGAVIVIVVVGKKIIRYVNPSAKFIANNVGKVIKVISRL
jgi:hypothetical protein